VHVLRVHIRVSGNYSHEPVRLEASHYSEKLIIAKNTVRQAFARAAERLAKVAKR
jgi:hypothetical protein